MTEGGGCRAQFFFLMDSHQGPGPGVRPWHSGVADKQNKPTCGQTQYRTKRRQQGKCGYTGIKRESEEPMGVGGAGAVLCVWHAADRRGLWQEGKGRQATQVTESQSKSFW